MHQHFPFQGPPKFSQSGLFGLNLNHLATLVINDVLFFVAKDVSM
jgi:hypothetical protein